MACAHAWRDQTTSLQALVTGCACRYLHGQLLVVSDLHFALELDWWIVQSRKLLTFAVSSSCAIASSQIMKAFAILQNKSHAHEQAAAAEPGRGGMMDGGDMSRQRLITWDSQQAGDAAISHALVHAPHLLMGAVPLQMPGGQIVVRPTGSADVVRGPRFWGLSRCR